MKASSVTIAAVIVAAAIAFPAMVRADDAGPARDVRAIRQDLPVLVASQVETPASVDDVVVQGDAALATWHAGAVRGIAGLHRRRDRWWARGFMRWSDGDRWRATSPMARLPENCTPAFFTIESATAQRILGVDDVLMAAALTHSAFLQTSAASQPRAGTRNPIDCVSGLAPDPVVIEAMDGYDFVLTLSRGSGPLYATTLAHGRAPTDGEMPPAPNVNAYYFLYLRSNAARAPAFPAGSTLDVWFPFVLQPYDRYALWLGFVDPPIEGLRGTLHNNVLHFELPAFAMTPGKEAMGEIDGPYR